MKINKKRKGGITPPAFPAGHDIIIADNAPEETILQAILPTLTQNQTWGYIAYVCTSPFQLINPTCQPQLYHHKIIPLNEEEPSKIISVTYLDLLNELRDLDKIMNRIYHYPMIYQTSDFERVMELLIEKQENNTQITKELHKIIYNIYMQYAG